MIGKFLVPLALLASTPAAAQLTIQPGETWIFSLKNGQPAHAQKVRPDAAPRAGQVKASVRLMMGTNLTISSNARVGYTFRAELLDAAGKAKTARACTLPPGGKPAFEYWRDSAAALRLGEFRPATRNGSCP